LFELYRTMGSRVVLLEDIYGFARWDVLLAGREID
jgi:hypothetical protein